MTVARRRRLVQGPWTPTGGVDATGRRIDPFSRVGLAPGVAVADGKFVNEKDGTPWSPYGFKPYEAPEPPAGSYDPALDAQEGAAHRGLFDLEQDTGTGELRDRVDYGVQRDDLLRTRDRGLSDLSTSATREGENYGASVAQLQRSFQRLGGRQAQQANSAGVMSGGALLQAAAKRATNEQIERAPIDTQHGRFIQDNTQSRTRLVENSDEALGKLALELAPPDENNPFGGRRWQDRTTALTRAQREGAQFGLDIGAQRSYQAAGSGWDPPTRPANEFVNPLTGAVHRVLRQGRDTIGVDPAGHELWRRPRKRR